MYVPLEINHSIPSYKPSPVVAEQAVIENSLS